MIKITIQGKNQEENQLAWENGKTVQGEMELQKNYYEISQVMEKYDFVRNGVEEAKLTQNINLMYIFHPEKDDIGRVRVAMIIWDNNSDQNEIEQTVKLAGLEYQRFLQIKTEAKTKNRKQTAKYILIGGGIGLLVGAVATDTALKAITYGVIGSIGGYAVKTFTK
ncbi:hypothetical protein OFO10_05625 [Campylobacter sp. VBCF_06 NA8]|uniref:hypothetical protein n=1 Tax=Campylobacter sp. VBCF_06 NA8 TaxID=2983822 RepID=UPI0022EA0765|nr:hypothetical protein [Campylobacter sp. VBCF_06 NA8]MDA3046633.1 hypothetical protein [Campylobacter sp. VBCF_06 NA8]